MIVTRIDQAIVRLLHHLVAYCIRMSEDLKKGICVVVDEYLRDNPEFGYSRLIEAGSLARESIKFWSVKNTVWCSKIKNIKCMLTLGGDGTILYAIRLFRNYKVPPIISFNLGSLGFLTMFSKDDIKRMVDMVLDEKIDSLPIDIRVRLGCVLYRDAKIKERSVDMYDTSVSQNETEFGSDERICACAEWEETVEQASVGHCSNFILDNHQRFLPFGNTAPANDTPDDPIIYREIPLNIVLNDVIIDRGISTISVQLFLYIDNVQVTIIQADGIIISTPTGSTAYSLSSNGSLVHPDSSVILITPICTHTLSFRPIIIPDTRSVKIKVPENTRTPVNACFDGRSRMKLYGGDYLIISKSESPVRFICKDRDRESWFSALKTRLNWNMRIVQRPCSSIDLYHPIIGQFSQTPVPPSSSPNINS